MRTHLQIATLAAAGVVSWTAVAARVAAQALTVKSPDGKLTVTLSVKSLPAPYASGARPYYSVSFEGQPLLADSRWACSSKARRK